MHKLKSSKTVVNTFVSYFNGSESRKTVGKTGKILDFRSKTVKVGVFWRSQSRNGIPEIEVQQQVSWREQFCPVVSVCLHFQVRQEDKDTLDLVKQLCFFYNLWLKEKKTIFWNKRLSMSFLNHKHRVSD